MRAQDAAWNASTVFDQGGEVRFNRVVVGGLPVAVLDRQQTAKLTIAAAISRRGSGRRCLFFTTINGQVVSLCASDASVRRLFEQADLISADGMSIVFASRLGPGQALPELRPRPLGRRRAGRRSRAPPRSARRCKRGISCTEDEPHGDDEG